MSGIALIGLILFLVIQNQIVDIETKSIETEVRIKLQTERLLFDLRETLVSGASIEDKATESLSIINEIRKLLDSEYIYLRLDAQRNINIIHGKINKIEESILEGNIDEAVELVDELINTLEKSDNLGELGGSGGNSSNGNSGTNTENNPDFSENENTSPTNTDNSNNSNNNNNTGATGTEVITDTEGTEEQNPFIENENGTYDGIVPDFDRDRSKRKHTEEESVDLKIGE